MVLRHRPPPVRTRGVARPHGGGPGPARHRRRRGGRGDRPRPLLLAAGITGCTGDFTPGDVVEIVDAHGRVRARGLVQYSSSQLPGMLGRTTADLREDLGAGYDGVVVHADDWVRLAPPQR